MWRSRGPLCPGRVGHPLLGKAVKVPKAPAPPCPSPPSPPTPQQPAPTPNQVSHRLPRRPQPLSSETGPPPIPKRSRPSRRAGHGAAPYPGPSLCLWAGTGDAGITQLEGGPSVFLPPAWVPTGAASTHPPALHRPVLPRLRGAGSTAEPFVGCPRLGRRGWQDIAPGPEGDPLPRNQKGP